MTRQRGSGLSAVSCLLVGVVRGSSWAAARRMYALPAEAREARLVYKGLDEQTKSQRHQNL